MGLELLQQYKKDVSVLMLSWKDAYLLHDWLDAFIKFARKDIAVEVIILDNGSGDPEFDRIVEKYKKLGDFRFLKNPTNECIPALNKLVPLAKGKYIILAAPGAPFLNDVIGTMKGYLGSHPKIGAVSAKFMNEDGTFQNVYKRFLSLPRIFLEGVVEIGRKPGVYLARYFNLFHTVPRDTDPIEPFPIQRAHLCSFMLRREALDEGPLIEPKIPLGPCDADLCLRIYKRGYKIVGLPQAMVIHHRSVAYNLHREDKKPQHNILGTLQYFKKNHPVQYPLLKTVFILDQLCAILRLKLTGLNKNGEVENNKKELALRRRLLSLLLKRDINVI